MRWRPLPRAKPRTAPQFVDMAEEALGAHIDVLSGKEEARLAAMGVMAGITGADGLVGDLGGGSLELIDVSDGTNPRRHHLAARAVAAHGHVGRIDRQGARDHRRDISIHRRC